MAELLLTDIEGTTSSIAFVKETLFPYARARLREFVAAHRETPEVAAQIEAVRSEVGGDEADAVETLVAWLDADRKAGPLKALQGLIWEAGYRDGTLRGHVYPDAARGLRRAKDRGVRLAVYSSGSVRAQRLLFEHSTEGDLSGLFEAHFDTRIGPKREAESYRAIARSVGLAPGRILFTSDVEAELDAAKEAGLAPVQVVRPPDGTSPSARHRKVSSFDELDPLWGES
jgi:enolase-phosphatase E1